MPPRRRAAAAAGGLQTPGLSIAALPDDLLIRCLAILTQQERFQNAALVSKRFQRLCLAPRLLRTVTYFVRATDCPRRGDSLLEFLMQNGEHVHCLHIDGLIFIPEAQRQEVAGMVTACLTACGAAGKLEELSVGLHMDTPLPSTAWLAGLTACRRLRLGNFFHLLRLPPSFSQLTALTDAELTGRPIELCTTASLPSALARLKLRDSSATTLPRQLSSLSALASLDLVDGQYASDGFAMLAHSPALRHLSLSGFFNSVRLPASLSTVTQLERLIVSPCIDDDSAVLAAVLLCLTGLTSLCLDFEARPGGLAAIAQLPRLHRLLLKTGMGEESTAAERQLPPGPWLNSIRWLGLPWPVLEAGVGVLRGAPQLEYLYSSGTPKYNIHASEAWRAFWQFVATHPPLRCLAFAPEEEEEAEPVPDMLFNELLTLHHRRPGLQLRQLVEAWVFAEDESTFLFEVTECQGIPTGPGSFEAF